MKKIVVAVAWLALFAGLAATVLVIVKEVTIRQELTHEMNAADKYGYTLEQFVDKRYVGPMHGETWEERRDSNKAIINEFYDKVKRGEKAALNIVYWGIEGQPIFQHFYFNGRTYQYVVDRSQDGHSDMKIERSVCKDMQFPAEAGVGPIGVLMDCKTYSERIIVQ